MVVQLRRSRPVLVVSILIVVAVLAMIVFRARTTSIVYAPGVLYPLRSVQLMAPSSDARVVEVYKHEGDIVHDGEIILLLDGEDEKLRREQAQKKLEGLVLAIKERAIDRQERALKLGLSKLAVRAAAAGVEAEQGRLDEANALLKRTGSEASKVEISLAEEKVKYAEKNEEEAKTTDEHNELMFAKKALPEDELRKGKLLYEKAKSQTQQQRYELTLLKDTTVITRSEEAKALINYRTAAVNAGKVLVEERRLEVTRLELLLDYDPLARQLAVEMDTAKLDIQRLEKILNEKSLRAPLSGVLHNFRVQAGQWMTNRAGIGWIHDTSTLVFHAQVQQRDLPSIKPGQKAKILFDALMTRDVTQLGAEVMEISEVDMRPTNDIGQPFGLLEDARFTSVPHALVRLKVTSNAAGNTKLRPGFTGQAKILIGEGVLTKIFY